MRQRGSSLHTRWDRNERLNPFPRQNVDHTTSKQCFHENCAPFYTASAYAPLHKLSHASSKCVVPENACAVSSQGANAGTTAELTPQLVQGIMCNVPIHVLLCRTAKQQTPPLTIPCDNFQFCTSFGSDKLGPRPNPNPNPNPRPTVRGGRGRQGQSHGSAACVRGVSLNLPVGRKASLQLHDQRPTGSFSMLDP